MDHQKHNKQALLWNDLNERQRSYLLAIYETDQEEEANVKERAAIYRRSRPDEEWRWLKYGRDEIRGALKPSNAQVAVHSRELHQPHVHQIVGGDADEAWARLVGPH